MEYLNLFENFEPLPSFGTLRDLIRPGHFEDDDAYHAALDAAAITVEVFGLDSETDAKELADMGVIDRAELIKSYAAGTRRLCLWARAQQ